MILNKIRSYLWKLHLGFWIYGLLSLLGSTDPKLAFRSQAPNIDFFLMKKIFHIKLQKIFHITNLYFEELYDFGKVVKDYFQKIARKTLFSNISATPCLNCPCSWNPLIKGFKLSSKWILRDWLGYSKQMKITLPYFGRRKQIAFPKFWEN